MPTKAASTAYYIMVGAVFINAHIFYNGWWLREVGTEGLLARH